MSADDNYARRMRASNDESLEPARPQIGKAGENVEDQDTHGILLG